jgi:hypothetical protein
MHVMRRIQLLQLGRRQVVGDHVHGKILASTADLRRIDRPRIAMMI